MPHIIFVELFYLSSLTFPADVPNSALLFLTIIDEYLFILQSQYPPSSALVSCSLCAFLSLSAKEVVIGLVFFYGNYFYTIFRKFSLLTKFCIKVIAATRGKIILLHSLPTHS